MSQTVSLADGRDVIVALRACRNPYMDLETSRFAAEARRLSLTRRGQARPMPFSALRATVCARKGQRIASPGLFATAPRHQTTRTLRAPHRVQPFRRAAGVPLSRGSVIP